MKRSCEQKVELFLTGGLDNFVKRKTFSISDPTVKISDFDDKDASKVSGKLDDRAKGDTAAGDRVELVENKLPE